MDAFDYLSGRLATLEARPPALRSKSRVELESLREVLNALQDYRSGKTPVSLQVDDPDRLAYREFNEAYPGHFDFETWKLWNEVWQAEGAKRMEQWRTGLDEREHTVEAREEKVSEREKWAAQAERDVGARDRALTQRTSGTESRSRALKGREAGMRDREKAVETREQALASVDTDTGDHLSTDEQAELGMLRESRQTRIKALLQTYPDTEQRVIELRFGITGGRPLPRREIAENLGITTDMAKKIERRGLWRLFTGLNVAPGW